MAKKSTARDQKKREKQKKRRDAARKSRGSRPAPVTASTSRERPSVKGCESWPLGECYLSENWSDQGARVHAGFVRQNDDGRCAAAFFEVDLAEDGVVEVMSRGGVTYPGVQGEMVRRSELADQAMHVAEPALVAKLVQAGLAHGRANDRPDPTGLTEAMGLFGDIDLEDAPQEILVGRPPEAPSKKKSLFSVLFG